MEKVLRSLIQEKFDLDTRTEIEFLSRRRDLVNAEKQEELIKLLQNKGIENIVPLGPGTNRYAFKLDGFVIKVATDHDGKIDNLKEFKMAKRLYPYVTKTYEVSENGTLLVAEYIQPFESYSEMYRYKDQILGILKKLSAVYLIGDVGLTPNNFANWGLRVGTQDPVCLDFAYVYEVSSELFICRACHTNSMLAPNETFTELYCTNPACKHRYLFQDIRTRIGNDVHAHEIGDLSTEGYRLTESHVLTELDEQRSNYLVRKREELEKKSKKKGKTSGRQTTETSIEEVNDMDRLDKIMQNAQVNAEQLSREPIRIRATASIPGTIKPPAQRVQLDATPVPFPEEVPGKQQLATAYGITGAAVLNGGTRESKVHEPEAPSEVAFTGRMDDSVLAGEDEPEEPTAVVSAPVVQMGVPNKNSRVWGAEAVQRAMDQAQRLAATGILYGVTGVEPTGGAQIKEEVVPPKNNPIKVTATVRVPQQLTATTEEEQKILSSKCHEETKPAEAPQEPDQPQRHQFNPGFSSRIDKAISKVTNRIKDQLYHIELFDEVRSSVKDKKMYPETFYRNIQNAAFKAMVAFCNLGEKDVPRDDGKGMKKAYPPPADMYGEYYPTLRFLERVWLDPKTTAIWNNEDFVAEYRKIYSDFTGIQLEWLTLFKQRMLAKMPIDQQVAERIAEIVKGIWCVPETPAEPEPPEDPPKDDAGAEASAPVEEPAPEPEAEPEPEPEAEAPAEDPWSDEKIEEYARDLLAHPNVTVNENMPTTLKVKLVCAILRLRGMELYGNELDTSNPMAVELAEFTYTVGTNISLLISQYFNVVTEDSFVTMSGRAENASIADKIISNYHYNNFVELLNAIIGFSAEDFCSAYTKLLSEQGQKPEATIADPMFASPFISGDDEGEEEIEEPEYLSVEVFYDETFDIIKVCSGEAFGPVAIPFYTKLDDVKLDGGVPSLVDDRNGNWDWLIHMVPDLMFRTRRPEYFLKVNEDDPDEEQVHIVILDNDGHGNYIMGIYYLMGVYVVDDDGERHPCFNEELLAKINRVVREDIGYGRISHLRRSLSMEQLINTEEYVINHVLQTTSPEPEEEEESEMTGEDLPNLNPAERAALSVMMHGSDALAPDAPQEQKDAADKIQQANYSALGVPTPDKMDSAPTPPEAQLEPAPEPEEELVMGQPPVQPTAPAAPTVPTGDTERPLPPGVFMPVHRKRN